MQETHVQWLDQEDSLEKEMATHSSVLASTDRGAWGYTPWDHKELDKTEQLTLSLSFLFVPFLVTQMVKTLPPLWET